MRPTKDNLAYSAIQKTYAALDAEIQGLSGPVSTNTVPLAGDIEDTATNSVHAANRLRRIVANLYGIVAIELMHAAQAIDLRRRANPRWPSERAPALCSMTSVQGFRSSISDRELTKDIAKATTFVRNAANGFRH